MRAARLRLKSHVYSKRAVGKEKDWEEKRAATAEPGSPDAKSGQIDGSLKSSGSKNNEQRRANQDKHHYIQGVMDWPYACKVRPLAPVVCRQAGKHCERFENKYRLTCLVLLP